MAVTRSTEQPRPNVWALGEFARVPNEATPERPDPPACQHALRQARCLVLGRDMSQLALMEQAKTGTPARAPEEELEVVST
jgi:hypothetical protein